MKREVKGVRNLAEGFELPAEPPARRRYRVLQPFTLPAPGGGTLHYYHGGLYFLDEDLAFRLAAEGKVRESGIQEEREAPKKSVDHPPTPKTVGKSKERG